MSRLSSRFADTVSLLGEDEQRDAIEQMLVELMDATEQSDTGEMVISAYAAFIAARPAPPPPPAASLPSDQQVVCRARIEIERLTTGATNVWIDSGPTSPETTFLGLDVVDWVPTVIASWEGERKLKLVIDGNRHVDITGTDIVEAAPRRSRSG